MNSSNRMRWRPAVGVLVLGGIAIGLTFQGASAEKGRTSPRVNAAKPAETPVVAELAPRRGVTTNRDALTTKAPAPKAPKVKGEAVGSSAAFFATTNGQSQRIPFGPEDLEAFVGEQAGFESADSLQNGSDVGTIAGPGTGACCVTSPSCACTPNQTPAQCTALAGTYQGDGTVCNAQDPCNCALRGCCSPAGVCVGDVNRPTCENAGNTFHPNSRCVPGTTATDILPTPVCNQYSANNCNWDNGQPLNDGGAIRQVNAISGDFNFKFADDFILRGPDSRPCNITAVRSYLRMRPSAATIPPGQPPNPTVDLDGVNVNIYCDYIHPVTAPILTNVNAGHQPGAHAVLPFLIPGDPSGVSNDLNPILNDTPGGTVYARHFATTGGSVTYTFLNTFCDPPPAEPSPTGFESEDVYQVDVVLNPPVLLNKNKKYWFELQGVLPFGEGGNNTLQTWAMLSQNNTGLRGMTHRVGSTGAWTISGQQVWLPLANSIGTGTPANGNQGAIAPCVNSTIPCTSNADCPAGINCSPASPNPRFCLVVPANTRWDLAFQLFGNKKPVQDPVPANDACANADPTGDGTTPFNTTAATNDGIAASCGAFNNDVWYSYTATCDGILTVSTCGSSFDSKVQVLDGASCTDPEISNGCNDNNTLICGGGSDDAAVRVLVTVTGQYMIRVGGATASDFGKGVLNIECQELCGSPDSADCCAEPQPTTNIGCGRFICCSVVCALDNICCGAFGGSWDQKCVDTAQGEAACGCPCPLNCTGNHPEAEACGADVNGGCVSGAPPVVEILGNVPLSPASIDVCANAFADGGLADIDEYQFTVEDLDASGEDKITITLTGDVPIGFNIQGVDNAACDNPTVFYFVRDSDLPDGSNGLSAHCEPDVVTVCLAPGDYLLVLAPMDSNGDQIFTDPFNAYACGGQTAYEVELSADPICLTGACCTCSGSCVQENQNDCFVQDQGTYQGDGTTCPQPAGVCEALAHSCATATLLTCGQTVMVDLTTNDLLPEVPYGCANAGANPTGTAWFRFVATAPSANISTCSSTGTGTDSLIQILDGECCSVANPIVPIQDGCSDDECGFTDFLGDVCIEGLTVGHTYWIEISNWDENTNGLYTLELNCPCTGSCCNSFTATCTDNVDVAACLAPSLFDELHTCGEVNPPCGFGSCCAPNGSCTDTTPQACPSGSNHRPGTLCSTSVCPVANTCSYDSGDIRTVGFISQYITNQQLLVEEADNFILKGTTGNPCRIDNIVFHVFHTDDTNTTMSDTPADYLGLVFMIANDVDDGNPNTLDKGPTCNPIDPPPPPNATSFHVAASGYPDGCKNEVVLGEDQTENPPSSGNYWSWVPGLPIDCGASPCFELTVHLDPPIILEKNKKNWLAFFVILQDENATGYNIVWSSANQFDGNFPRQWLTGDQDFTWSEVILVPPGDFNFTINGAKVAPGCGTCQREGDVFPPGPPGQRGNCNIDLDDLLYMIAAIGDPAGNPGADLSGCTNDYPCSSNQDCSDLYGFIGVACENVVVGPGEGKITPCVTQADCPSAIPCVAGLCDYVPSPQTRCANIDIDDLGTLLNGFANQPPICGDQCAPGACKNIPPTPCLVDADCPALVSCIAGFCDYSYDAPPADCHHQAIQGDGYSMSESDCFNLGGTYCGDYTACGDAGCP